MKKIILIILPIVLIATIGVFLFVNNNSNEDNTLAQNVVQNVDSNNEAGEEEVNSNEELVDYWVNTYEFPKETKPFSISLFNGFITPPIKLNDLENKCDYFVYHGKTMQDRGEHKVKKISDIKTTLEAGATLDVYLHMNDDSFAGLSKFTIENYSEENKTAQECLENGWWYAWRQYDNNSSAAKDLLGIDFWESGITVDDEGIYILEDIITKLGRPTKINTSKGALDKKDGFSSSNYHIIYEYSDFVFVIDVQEIVDFDDNDYLHCYVHLIMYNTPESWKYEWRNDSKYVDILN